MLSFSSDKYPGMELLDGYNCWWIHSTMDCMVVLFLIFWGISILFSILAIPTHIPTNSVWGFSLLHIVFLIAGILPGVSWNLTVVLICISLMLTDVEHPFMCLFYHGLFYCSCTIFHSHQQFTSVLISPYSFLHLSFFIITILMGVKWHFMLVLICISVITSGIEPLFTCLLTICISLEKHVFMSFAHY